MTPVPSAGQHMPECLENLKELPEPHSILHRLLGDCTLMGSRASGTPRGSLHQRHLGRERYPSPFLGAISAW